MNEDIKREPVRRTQLPIRTSEGKSNDIYLGQCWGLTSLERGLEVSHGIYDIRGS